MKVINHTPDQLREWERVFAENPRHRKFRELVVTYARSQGGLTLKALRLEFGPFFGEPIMMRSDAIAERLGVPVSDLAQIQTEMWAWMRPRLADPGQP